MQRNDVKKKKRKGEYKREDLKGDTVGTEQG